MQSDSSKAYENARAEYERLSGQPAFIRLIRRKKLDEAETDMREKHNVWVSEEVSALANAWTPERLPPYRMMAELDARFGTDRGTVRPCYAGNTIAPIHCPPSIGRCPEFAASCLPP